MILNIKLHLTILVLLGLALAAFNLNPDPDLKRLQAAPERVKLYGVSLRLDTYLWRNFMPSTDQDTPKEPPLLASIKLLAEAGKNIPAGIDINKVWLIRGQEVWSTTEIETGPVEKPPYKMLERMVRTGPAWPTGSKITVVVLINDSKTKRQHLLRISNQEINKTF